MASSADISWSVDAGVAHTDNAALTDANTVSDTLASIGGTIAFEQETRRIKAALNGYGSHVHYLDGTFDDDFLGRATGSLVVALVPERFLWTVEDTFGQIANDPFEPPTPENRQNVNNFSTGPDVFLRLGDQSRLHVSGRYGDTNYEDSGQINTHNWEGALGFRRELASTASLGIRASHSRFEYGASGVQPYDQQAIYASWQSTGARQDLALDLGSNRVEVSGVYHSEPLLRLNWKRRPTPSWTMDVDLRSEYQNTAQQFANQTLPDVPGSSDIGISNVPAALHHAGLSFSFERSRTRFSLGGDYSQLEYVEFTGLDESMWHGFVDFSRRLTPRIEGFLRYRMGKRDYDAGIARDSREQIFETGVDWSVGKSTYITLGYRHRDSESDSPINTYTDNAISLRVSYRQGTITGANAFTY